jgi:hypothetical protein
MTATRQRGQQTVRSSHAPVSMRQRLGCTTPKRSTTRQIPGQALVARVLAEMRSKGMQPDGRETELLTLARGGVGSQT